MRTCAKTVVNLLCAACLLAAASLPLAAGAAPHVVDRVSADQLAFVLRELGYGRSQVDGDGDLLVSLGPVNVLAMVGSYGGGYISLQAPLVGVDVSLEQVNDWNRREPYARAYINPAGHPVLGAELDLTGGVTVARIEHFVRTFAHTSVPKFVERMR